MTKRILILVLFQIILFDVFSQAFCEKKHIYGVLSNFYYLNIYPEQNYSLKVGMYSNAYFVGETEMKYDSLELTSRDQSSFAIRKMAKYQIIDSLLIPLAYKELLPISWNMLKDTTVCKEYLQTDYHVHYKLTFHSDSSFIYSTGSDMTRNITKGQWTQIGNEIRLKPESSDNLLYWICTNNKLIEVENYLVGRTFDMRNKIIEFHYLIGLKPRVKKQKKPTANKS